MNLPRWQIAVEAALSARLLWDKSTAMLHIGPRTYLSVLIGLVLVAFLMIRRSRSSGGYFRAPLDRSLQLAANFGELREGHFHMGIDIRTGGREGLPVYAAADGYISHLSIGADGLGKALFITHPNGLVTVYGHLQHFADSLDALAFYRQYAMQSWQQELDLPPDRCQVKKGTCIAYSGNTGASRAPHLHFEVRDTHTGCNVNPQLQGLRADDDLPPVINGLYWYDRRYSTYMTKAQKIPIAGRDRNYHTVQSIIRVNSPLLSLGISAADKCSSSSPVSGVFEASLWLDNSLIHAFSMRDLSSSDTRYINACIDYSKWFRSGIYVQHLSTLPGNHAPIFTVPGRDGLIHLQDTLVHTIRIRTADVRGNYTELQARIQCSDAAAVTEAPTLLHAAAFRSSSLFSSGNIPCSPGKATDIDGPSFRVHFTAAAFYDHFPLHWQSLAATDPRWASPIIYLHDPTVPVHDRFSIQLKTALPKGSPLRSRTVLQLISGDSQYIVKGSWQDKWMSATFNRLGILRMIIDTIAPSLTTFQWEEGEHFSQSAGICSIQCKDDLGPVARFRGEIDGHWVPFAQKGSIFTYTFDATCPRGAHTLTLTAVDVAGNKIQRKMHFVRE
jgi:hypothetical protein